jgi:hypothetical protein
VVSFPALRGRVAWTAHTSVVCVAGLHVVGAAGAVVLIADDQAAPAGNATYDGPAVARLDPGSMFAVSQPGRDRPPLTVVGTNFGAPVRASPPHLICFGLRLLRYDSRVLLVCDCCLFVLRVLFWLGMGWAFVRVQRPVCGVSLARALLCSAARL